MSETPCPFCGQIHGTACNAHQEAEAYTDLAADAEYKAECDEWLNAPMGRPETCPTCHHQKHRQRIHKSPGNFGYCDDSWHDTPLPDVEADSKTVLDFLCIYAGAGSARKAGLDAFTAMSRVVVALTQANTAKERAEAALQRECPRTAHVDGCDTRPDDCESVGATAETCNIAHGLGWKACPEYPAQAEGSK